MNYPKSHLRNFKGERILSNLQTYENPPITPSWVPEEINDPSRKTGTIQVYKGINIYNTIPNRYQYSFDTQVFPGLYYQTETERRSDATGIPATDITPQIFPYTNRGGRYNIQYTNPKIYESLITNLNLHNPLTFYK